MNPEPNRPYPPARAHRPRPESKFDQIYDTTDPLNPELVSGAVNAGSYAHGVFPTSDGELMVGNNESLLLGGLLVPGTAPCPGEGLAAYDLRNEGAPVGPLGHYVPDVLGPSEDICTSHFGRFVPGTRVMSIGWYAAGVRVVDWSQPSAPREVAGAVLEGTNTWAAKIHTGPYVYAGDIGRGFDVFRWAGDGPAPWLAGERDDEASADDARGTVEVEVEADAGCEACPVNPEADVRVEVPPGRRSPQPDRSTPADDAEERLDASRPSAPERSALLGQHPHVDERHHRQVGVGDRALHVGGEGVRVGVAAGVDLVEQGAAAGGAVLGQLQLPGDEGGAGGVVDHPLGHLTGALHVTLVLQPRGGEPPHRFAAAEVSRRSRAHPMARRAPTSPLGWPFPTR